MKSKEEYLRMIPEYLDRDNWIKTVNDMFDSDNISIKNADFLDEYFLVKPRSLEERWLEAAKGYTELMNEQS